MSYYDPLLGQHAIDVRTEAALFAHENAGMPYDRPSRDEYDDDPGYPANADEYNEQWSENLQAMELDTWPYDDEGYPTEGEQT